MYDATQAEPDGAPWALLNELVSGRQRRLADAFLAAPSNGYVDGTSWRSIFPSTWSSTARKPIFADKITVGSIEYLLGDVYRAALRESTFDFI
jgi:hypothetical protein